MMESTTGFSAENVGTMIMVGSDSDNGTMETAMSRLQRHYGATSSTLRNASDINAAIRAHIYQHFMQIIREKQYTPATEVQL